MRIKYGDVASAAKRAITAAGDAVKTEARAVIGAAGLGPKWRNALRVDIHPKRGDSVNAAAWIYHKIHYAGVFEEGATITGKPLLWLPLRGTPKKFGRVKLTPKVYNANIGKLVFIKSKSGKPLLAGKAGLTKSGKTPKASMAALKRGAAGGPAGLVPLFVGVKSIKIPKKFSVADVCQKARNLLPELYARYFEDR